MPEAWHIRYRVKNKDIHDSGLSLEEYFGNEGMIMLLAANLLKANQPLQVPSTFQRQALILTGRTIKAEAKVSSPELAYYGKGMSGTMR